MGINSVKGYFLVIPSGLVLFAAGLFVILNWGRPAKVTIYGSPDLQLNSALLMIFSAAGGVVIVLVAKIMIRGLLALRRAARAAKASPKGPAAQEQSQE